MDLRVIIDDERALRAFAEAPAAMERNIGESLDRAALEVAREMQDQVAPHDVTANLKDSIGISAPNPLERFIGTSMPQARYLDQGTGPAAGNPRYYPNPDNLLDFITEFPKPRGFAWARPNSGKRESQRLELWFRARALAWSIFNKGTRAYPFVKPTYDKMESRVIQLVREGTENGVREAFGR